MKTIATICIIIEFWHIFYYMFLYERYFRRIENVATWANSYDKLHKSFVEFTNHYIENEELQQVLGVGNFKIIDNILDMLNNVGPLSRTKRKIFEICSMKQIALFLLQQAIEVCYWVFIVNLAIVMPYATGIIMFLVIAILCSIQKYFNKDKNTIYMIADSLFCIVVYAGIIFIF